MKRATRLQEIRAFTVDQLKRFEKRLHDRGIRLEETRRRPRSSTYVVKMIEDGRPEAGFLIQYREPR